MQAKVHRGASTVLAAVPKYKVGVVPSDFLNMEVNALGVL
jgi:hypothetical protein